MAKEVTDLGIRKLQKQSKSLYVSIPKLACKLFDLKKGSSLRMSLDSKGNIVLKK